jgi:hypothetical protein
MPIPAEIAEARRSARPVRVFRSDGEVIVLHVLDCDEHHLVYSVLTSSHPERYGVCDSTGFSLPLGEIERLQLLDRAPPLRRAIIE